MNIKVNGISNEKFHRPLQLIANLFFEETKIHVDATTEADLTITFAFNIKENILHAQAVLEAPNHKNIVANFQQVFEDTEDEKLVFKQYKFVLSHVYLTVLQEYTGIEQKWGILTGVRPTKLLHQKNRLGIPRDIAKQQLKDDYLIHDEKIELMQQIVDRQLDVIPDLYDLQKEVSIYIGIPFCPTKCAYCTFPAFAMQGKQGRVDSFLSGLHYEMLETGKWLKERGVRITTVYYGGGTPTSISAEEMDDLYQVMEDAFPDVKHIREITVEAGRPDTITEDKLEVLKKWNIDRISINPQSYTQETLKAIGRHHTVEETIEKFHLAREMGMNNINMDLIIGLPGEGESEFLYSLDETEKLMPESLTVHTLSFKRASEMTLNRDKYKVADRKETEKMMSAAQEWTKAHDYEPYYLYRQKNILGNLENVGYAQKDQDSLYNIIIMEEVQTIIGLGVGAASKFIDSTTGKITQFSNPKDPKTFNEKFIEFTEKKLDILDKIFPLKVQ